MEHGRRVSPSRVSPPGTPIRSVRAGRWLRPRSPGSRWRCPRQAASSPRSPASSSWPSARWESTTGRHGQLVPSWSPTPRRSGLPTGTRSSSPGRCPGPAAPRWWPQGRRWRTRSDAPSPGSRPAGARSPQGRRAAPTRRRPPDRPASRRAAPRTFGPASRDRPDFVLPRCCGHTGGVPLTKAANRNLVDGATEGFRGSAPGHLGSVARRELDGLLGVRDAGGELSLAFQLGVELGAEEQRQVGDPEPHQEHDDRRE